MQLQTASRAHSHTRWIGVFVIASVALFAGSGCKWFRKNDPYAMSAESRPLEVPPAFDAQQPDSTAATGSVMRSSMSSPSRPSASPLSFVIAGSRADVFAQVGRALESTAGLTIASRAQALSAYDVDYEGSKFLVRVSDADNGSLVSAVDPRGVAAQGEGPAKLIAALKAALTGR